MLVAADWSAKILQLYKVVRQNVALSTSAVVSAECAGVLFSPVNNLPDCSFG